jgi:hypothetical protein
VPPVEGAVVVLLQDWADEVLVTRVVVATAGTVVVWVAELVVE